MFDTAVYIPKDRMAKCFSTKNKNKYVNKNEIHSGHHNLSFKNMYVYMQLKLKVAESIKYICTFKLTNLQTGITSRVLPEFWL